MYAAIDALADKLDRMVVKHKEIRSSHRPENGGVKRAAATGGRGAAK
jgi:ribosome-associated translation inhibitor RaiA